MILFIKNYDLDTVKNKLILLYTLNITDIIFTLILVNTGYYIEANSLMVNIVSSYTSSFIVKIILPAILLLYLYFRIQKANEYQLKISNIIINLATGLYAIINMFHILWFLLLPVFMFI